MLPKDRFYNVIFPIWMLLLFPQLWIITLPLNLFIDWSVLWFTMGHLQVPKERRKCMCKQVILLVWLLGFTADFIGAFLMLVWNIVDFRNVAFCNAIMYHPFQRWDAFFWVTFCVLLTALIIYWFDFHVALKNLPFEEKLRQKLALSLAVFTAPYLFYIPTAWLW